MAITNAQAVAFCNGRARIMADLIETMDRTATQFMLDVVENWEEVAEVIAAGDSDAIVDSTPPDGRTPRTKVNVGEMKFVVEQVQACLATDDRRALIHGWVTNSQPKF